MLKNVMRSKEILTNLGFRDISESKYNTIMERNGIKAEVTPNGSVIIDGVMTEYKKVLKGKIVGL